MNGDIGVRWSAGRTYLYVQYPLLTGERKPRVHLFSALEFKPELIQFTYNPGCHHFTSGVAPSIQRTDDPRTSREGGRAAGFLCIEFLATTEAAIDTFHRGIGGVRSTVSNQQAQERENHKSREGILSVTEGRKHVTSLIMWHKGYGRPRRRFLHR
jgi:hypothetical protein